MSIRTASVSNAEILAAIKLLEGKIERNRTELLDLIRLHQANTDARLDQFYHEQAEVLKLAETFTQEIMEARGARQDIKVLKMEIAYLRRKLTPQQEQELNAQIARELDSINEVGA